MDHKGSGIRLRVLAGIFLAVMAVFLGVLYDTQVNDYEYYYASSIRTIARPEAVEAARGNLTDRDGKVLASSRPSYNLTFDASLLDGGQDESQALLRLLELCRDRGLTWEDGLPISLEAPFAYRLDTLGSSARGRFLTYLREDLEDAAEALGDYLLRHPDLLETVDEDGERKNPADRILASDRLDTDRKKADALLEELTADQLSAALLSGAGLSADRLISLMREDLDVPAAFSDGEARLVLGVQYEIRSRDLSREDPYVLAEDIDRETISLLNDGAYAGAKVSLSSVREYETAYAAHILGYLGSIESQEEKDALGEGYAWNDSVGKTGAEAAFEKYLKGDDGTRVVSMNEDGKVTGEYYSTEPVPGATVELTVDLDLQQAVEDALAATIQEMDRTDPNDRRGGAAVVLDIDTREVLAMASYPTYDLSTFRQPEIFAALNTDTRQPFNNRATQGHYAPGSTLKPLTAVAALEEGAIPSTTERLRCPYRWYYPNDPTRSHINCVGGDHGRLNVTEAITKSCNYFFAEMGYRLGMDTFLDYLDAFGLGKSTGIEIGDYAGTLPENPEGQDRAPWAAFGQGNQDYSPLQIANYIATLVSGGKLLQPHLLKAVKSYDSAEILAVGQAEELGSVAISPETLEAVKKGMLGYTQPGGSVYSAFRDCVVTAGAKTGTSQLGGDQTENGLFVCFAPYDDPEIAVAIVIEHATWGANAARAGVEILNAYFTAGEDAAPVTGENQLLP